jgi:hypothetical protein
MGGMMVLKRCAQCGIRFYAQPDVEQQNCWRCERSVQTETAEVADGLLAQVFPDGLPADS